MIKLHPSSAALRMTSAVGQQTYRVPYDYYICNVKLENFNLSHVPVYIMSQEQLSMYATYMSVLGNREDLFGDSPYVDKYITNPPADYDVNPEYRSGRSEGEQEPV